MDSVRDESAVWHLSPVVDGAAFHFGWLWPLAALWWTGLSAYESMTGNFVLLLALALTSAHRHATLLYAYGDPGARRQSGRRLWVFPGLVVLAFLATPFLLQKVPAAHSVFPVIVFLAVLWNFWHVLMQKYGLLRMYDAKAGGARVPAEVDRALVWCWVPLFLVYVGPKYQGLILDRGSSVASLSGPVLEAMRRTQLVTLPLAIALAATGVAAFAWQEYRIHGFRNRARLSMASGLMLIFAAFLLLDPVNCYIAFGFNHALEYLVFLGGAQARKRPRDGKSPAWLAYFLVLLALVGGYATLRCWSLVFPQVAAPVLGGVILSLWLFYWDLYSSLIHFYLDGFLWRRPAS